MRIEVVAIGNEVLCGMTVNTNATFISKMFSEEGWEVARHTVLADHAESLPEELQEIWARSDVVIVTGGLGPTLDDVTRKAIAALFHSPFHFHAAVAEDLKKRFGEVLISLEDQATIPKKARPLLNSVGTAPGLLFEEGGKILVALPGVPREMQAIVRDQVVPYLRTKLPRKYVTKLLHLALLFESKVDPFLKDLSQKIPGLNVGIYPDLGNLHISFSAKDPADIQQAEEALTAAFPKQLFLSSTGSIVEPLQMLCIQKGKTLALAESCTGGAMAQLVTSLSGSSKYFLGSIVAYANSLKETLLGVSAKTLLNHGAVSEHTVLEMLKGLFHKTGADLGIAVSGVAGPTGGTPEKPVGTLWVALGERNQPAEVFCFHAFGNRETVIQGTAQKLLSALWIKLFYNTSVAHLFNRR